MKQRFTYRMTMQLACIAFTAAAAYGFTPVRPGNLKAEANSVVVDLSWEWGNAGTKSLYESFEDETFPPASWNVENTQVSEEGTGNWLRYDFTDNELMLQHDGNFAAVLMLASDYDESDPATAHQDEWLIATPGEGAVYLDFWYYLHPQLLEDGAYREFPDHYYVMISRDGGEQWEELWDGRWDMGNVDDVQQASIFLGEPSDENTRVAFRAVSADEESLYYTWIVDDISFYRADGENVSQLKSSPRRHIDKSSLAGLNLRRPYSVPADTKKAIRPARIPESEWLNNGFTTYRVYLDDKLVGDYLKVRHFTEWSSKEAGEHTYRVCAWSEAEDKEYDSAEITVTTTSVDFAVPQNVKALYKETSPGKYTVSIQWESPETDLPVDHYNIYMNDRGIGWIDEGEDLSLGQTGLYKGAYKLTVEAVYAFPEGTSAPVSCYVYPGTVPTVRDLKVTEFEGGKFAKLEWTAPLECDETLTGYNVYCGDELLASSLKETSYTDNKPLDGIVRYSVHAVYDKSGESLPESAEVKFSEDCVYNLPLVAKFDNGHAPAGWTTELVDPNMKVKEMYSWRFDNWFDMDVPAEAGMSGRFASVSGVAGGMNRLEAHLVSPTFELPEGKKVEVAFNKFWREEKAGPSGNATFELQISYDGGETWENVSDLTKLDNGETVCALPDASGEVKIRFSFLGRMSGEGAIDNVNVRESKGTSVSEFTADDKPVDIYTVDGIVVGLGLDADYIKSMPAGIYIVRSQSKTSKVVIR